MRLLSPRFHWFGTACGQSSKKRKRLLWVQKVEQNTRVGFLVCGGILRRSIVNVIMYVFDNRRYGLQRRESEIACTVVPKRWV
jgi:hypothetical protein